MEGSRLDRHRGSGCPLTPAKPPGVRVRTRRFEMVTLAPRCRRGMGTSRLLLSNKYSIILGGENDREFGTKLTRV